ncbi:hypothetical protein ACHAQH_000533 [Verticillium albo-atrum]
MVEKFGPACGPCHGVAAAEVHIPNVNEVPTKDEATHLRDEPERMEQTPTDDQQQHLYTSETPADEQEPVGKPTGRGGKNRLRMTAERVACEAESQWALLLRDICAILHDLSRLFCHLIPPKAFVWTLGVLYLIAKTPEAITLFFTYLSIVVVERRLLFDLQGRYLGMKQAHRRAMSLNYLEQRMEAAEKEANESKERVKVLEMKLDRLYERNPTGKAAFSEL